MNKYIQVELKLESDFTEIVIAELTEHHFDSFWEEEYGLLAYIEEHYFDESVLKAIQEKYWEARITYTFAGLESKNWNEEWEKNFQPITIADKIYIRAPFHVPNPSCELELIIEPKMSFGTGHHATTSMMIEHLLSTDLIGKRVMDVGCGSAILSIAAEKLGAAEIFAFDIDDWSVENSLDNIGLNNCTKIEIAKGTIGEVLPTGKYDLILANITRNILLEELHVYSSFLNSEGLLFLSGFYHADVAILKEAANVNGLQLAAEKTAAEDWTSLVFRK